MKAQVISFRCVLKNKLGKILSTSVNYDVLTLGEGAGIPLKGLSEGLQNMKAGEHRKIAIPAAQAYGFYDLNKLKRVSLETMPEDLKVGETVRLEEDKTLYRVIEMDEDFVTLDANHPLAGQDLIFEVEATHVRSATVEEVSGFNESPQSEMYH